ncbi:hypothetical protein ULVI_10550 [Cochleicola gelatinilyticus]|uniref:Uncharacterized protein n=1 Tax=Cochleicola gelatinilyticus TaxID=1763537 RepID=A0A167HAD5_9FLAO|nr:hypothetical protein ULVI_10550 [Cochleicola gelatinilyticus]
MTHTKIIIGIGVLIGLLLFNKTKPNFLKLILVGLSICFTLGYFMEFPIGTVAFMSFGILALVFSIWCVMNKNIISFLIGIFTFLSFVWTLFDYQFWNLLQFLMIIPLFCYIWTLIKYPNYKKELSVLTILASYELSEFLIIIGTWIK